MARGENGTRKGMRKEDANAEVDEIESPEVEHLVRRVMHRQNLRERRRSNTYRSRDFRHPVKGPIFDHCVPAMMHVSKRNGGRKPKTWKSR